MGLISTLTPPGGDHHPEELDRVGPRLFGVRDHASRRSNGVCYDRPKVKPLTPGRLGNERQLARDQGAPFDRALACHAADSNGAVRILDVGQLVETVQVDEHGRRRQAEIHGRYQALPARERLGIAGMFRKQRQRLVHAAGPIVVEGCRLHYLMISARSRSPSYHRTLPDVESRSAQYRKTLLLGVARVADRIPNPESRTPMPCFVISLAAPAVLYSVTPMPA